jgi:hypothetical protein
LTPPHHLDFGCHNASQVPESHKSVSRFHKARSLRSCSERTLPYRLGIIPTTHRRIHNEFHLRTSSVFRSTAGDSLSKCCTASVVSHARMNSQSNSGQCTLGLVARRSKRSSRRACVQERITVFISFSKIIASAWKLSLKPCPPKPGGEEDEAPGVKLDGMNIREGTKKCTIAIEHYGGAVIEVRRSRRSGTHGEHHSFAGMRCAHYPQPSNERAPSRAIEASRSAPDGRAIRRVDAVHLAEEEKLEPADRRELVGASQRSSSTQCCCWPMGSASISSAQ